MSQDRPYDIVVFGATGFTGGLTAAYLAEHAPTDCRWALAGRNRAKLEAVRSRLAENAPASPSSRWCAPTSATPRRCEALAESTRVVITTVGPYVAYGEPLVGRVRRRRHRLRRPHRRAGVRGPDVRAAPPGRRRVRRRIVHACGFDSIPHDLGALFTVKQLPEGRAADRLAASVRGSGTVLRRHLPLRPRGDVARRARTAAAAARPAQGRAAPEGRRSARAGRERPHAGPGRSAAGLMPMPTIDPQVVERSARALERYGPDFTYTHYARLQALSRTRPGRRRRRRARRRRPGAAAAQRSCSSGSRRARARARRSGRRAGSPSSSSARAAAERSSRRCSGGDPGYGETAKMLAESALCLAFDDNPPTSGQVTTAQAMGDNLLDRLSKSGIQFTVVSSRP